MLTAAVAAMLSAPVPAAPPQETAGPARGETMSPFEAQGVDGTVVRVSYPKTGTVLLFFLSSCPTCHKMLPEWNHAYERRPAGLQVIGLLLDQEPPGFFQATPIAFPVVRAPGREFLNRWKVSKVPLTVRLGPGGKVEDVGHGALDPIRLGELFHP